MKLTTLSNADKKILQTLAQDLVTFAGVESCKCSMEYKDVVFASGQEHMLLSVKKEVINQVWETMQISKGSGSYYQEIMFSDEMHLFFSFSKMHKFFKKVYLIEASIIFNDATFSPMQCMFGSIAANDMNKITEQIRDLLSGKIKFLTTPQKALAEVGVNLK